MAGSNKGHSLKVKKRTAQLKVEAQKAAERKKKSFARWGDRAEQSR